MFIYLKLNSGGFTTPCLFILNKKYNKVDHPTCNGWGNYEKWVQPDADDVQVVHIVQVLLVQVIGEWDLSKRQSIYYVENVKDIDNAFNAL